MYNKNYALITGAAGLLGPEHGSALAEIGFNLVLIDMNKRELVTKTSILQKKYSALNIIPVVCDVSSEKQVNKLFKNLNKKNVFISVLVNNADVNPKKKIYK